MVETLALRHATNGMSCRIFWGGMDADRSRRYGWQSARKFGDATTCHKRHVVKALPRRQGCRLEPSTWTMNRPEEMSRTLSTLHPSNRHLRNKKPTQRAGFSFQISQKKSLTLAPSHGHLGIHWRIKLHARIAQLFVLGEDPAHLGSQLRILAVRFAQGHQQG